MSRLPTNRWCTLQERVLVVLHELSIANDNLAIVPNRTNIWRIFVVFAFINTQKLP